MAPTDYRDYEDCDSRIVFYAIVKDSTRITSFHSSELHAWQEARRLKRMTNVQLKVAGYSLHVNKELMVLA